MLFNQLVCEIHVYQYGIEDLSIRVVTLQSLLDILQVSDHGSVFIDRRQLFSLLKLINNHHLVWLLLEKHKVIMIL